MSFFIKVRHMIFFLFVGTIIVGLFAYSIWGEYLPVEEVKGFVQSRDEAPSVFVLLYVLVTIFLPTTPFMAAAGVLFGFWYGLLYTTIAGFISAAVTFYLTRILGRPFVENVMEYKRSVALLDRYDEKIARHGILTTMILRMTPVMPFSVLNVIMGISKISFKDYALGSVIGLIPSNILTVYFGVLFLTETFRDLSMYISIAMIVGILTWFLFYRPRKTL